MVSTRCADERQRTNSFGILHADDLRDRSTHRSSHHVSGLDAGVVENRDGIVGHLLERIRPEGFVTLAGAAIVMSDHAVAPGENEPLKIPEVLVGSESLDHQHGWRRRTTEHVVVQTNAVGCDRVGHDATSHSCLGAKRTTPSHE